MCESQTDNVQRPHYNLNMNGILCTTDYIVCVDLCKLQNRENTEIGICTGGV